MVPPLVSVIIPAFNAMKYLPKTLESVQRQTFVDFEILIIDDGSSDHIFEWFSHLDDTRIELISQKHQGVSVARNTGIKKSKGEYIAFLDADDLWESSKLKKQVDYLNKHPEVGLVYTWTSYIDEYDNPTGTVIASHVQGDVWERLVITDGMISNGSVPMVRRCCLEKVGLFDSSLEFYEDRDMWIRIAAQYSFGVVKEVLNFYRRHGNNISKNREKMLKGWRKTIEKSFKSAPFEVLHLRSKSYGCMAIYQSWLSLEQANLKEAMIFRKQALLHYPQLYYSKNFIQLNTAIILTYLFGTRGYDGMQFLKKFVRRLLHLEPKNINSP